MKMIEVREHKSLRATWINPSMILKVVEWQNGLHRIYFVGSENITVSLTDRDLDDIIGAEEDYV